MKKWLIVLLCMISPMIYAQRITHEFRSVSMSEALKLIDAASQDYTVNFVYNELEDFTVTTTVKDKSVPDAIREILGFYPIRMTLDGKNIFVECYQKETHKFIGNVVDEKGMAIEYASVQLMQPGDSTFITGGVCNETGQFVIPCEQQRVIARLSCLGCEPLFTLFDRSNVGEIRMHSQYIHIKAVKVIATRPTIAHQGDRIAVDIRNSSLAIGNTGESLLQQLPGVWTKGGSIKINGISGAKVMVDNREIKLEGDALTQYLSTLKSENIDKIEVIAHPGAEFPAEGAGGVIRILMRERSVGEELTLGGTLDVIQYKATRPYLRYAFSNQKLGFNITYSGTFTYGNDNLLKSDEYTNNRKRQVIYDDKMNDYMKDRNYNLGANLYYDFTKRSKLSLNSSIMQWAKDEEMKSNTLISGAGAGNVRKTQTSHLEKQMMHSFVSSLNYNYSFDEKGSNKLLLMADYVRQYHYSVDDDYSYQNYGVSTDLLSEENERNNQDKPYTIVSAEARHTIDLGTNGTITSGVKGSHSEVWNSMSVSELSNGSWFVQPDMGYDFKYDENLQAAYIKYGLSRKTWSLTAGLREEYVHANANAGESKYHHLDLFPSLYISRSISDKHEFSASYARRTNRISYFNLIPYRFYSSRYTIMAGNPALKPDYSQTLEFSYKLMDKYHFTATYYWSNNGTSRYNSDERINGKTMTVTTTVDGVRQRLWNWDIYIPITIHKRWTMENEANMDYNTYKTKEVHNHGFGWEAYTRQTIILPADIRLEVLYDYTSSRHSAYGKTLDYHTLNASVVKRFLDDQLTTKLSVSSILCRQKDKSIVTTADIIQRSAMYGKYAPYVSFTINYTFSKGQKRSFQGIEHSNSQERNRAY